MKVSINNTSHFKWGDNCDGWWLKNDGQFTVIFEIMPAGSAEVKHYHQQTEQFFYCLQGELTIELDDFSEALLENEGISIKPSTPHQAKNVSDKSCVFLVVSSPSLPEDRVNLSTEG